MPVSVAVWRNMIWNRKQTLYHFVSRLGEIILAAISMSPIRKVLKPLLTAGFCFKFAVLKALIRFYLLSRLLCS